MVTITRHPSAEKRLSTMIEQTSLMDKLWTPDELADYFHTTTKVLANERSSGTGPRFVKRGTKVLYPESAIAEYLNSNTLGSTEEAAAAR
ncbi:helix-turn-helix domain-containing protein [Nocardia terpenica]|uniref:Helix-turn-helix domain-containing protein n=1 Tax=Nocardia terpenica TaxID=455432 RepID=A0A161XCL2_9NOCA|nr:helix-turn-helix domain-containing protein [Nocardia terpenica]KZM70968.1 hypothetical protein AWN90_41320 [Nocardia terpenica]NQE89722.1 helix-turn-helix domain-containing protein [Nocardia terpenica]